MSKLNYEKITRKKLVLDQQTEESELPDTGSTLDKKRYLEMKYGDVSEKKCGQNRTKREKKSTIKNKTILYKNKQSKEYNILDNYVLGDQIQHLDFGLGKVISINDKDKMTVVFGSVEKILVMNKKVA